MLTSEDQPVVVAGHLQPRLNRGLWLVKWLLLVPHAVVLFFLWVAVAGVSVVAWFAILLTGRYPRAIFDFVLGVMRWSWRVWFYSYGALGTDRYPPFTLAEEPDYPATLDIAYPQRLSRGLVLVKSWLLAIPHYLVLGFFLGIPGNADRQPGWPWSVGLVGLLVLIAAVALLFTTRYPRHVFDLVLGMDRWAVRVAAYALLMTDAYPPFRLDLGGEEAPPPPVAPGGDQHGAALVGSASSTPPRRWTPLRIVSLTLGSVLLAVAVGLGLGGGALLFADRSLRDDDGFLMTDGHRFTSDGYAVSTQDVGIHAGGFTHAVVGDVRLTVRGSGQPVFIGVAPTGEVGRYMRGVAHSVVSDVRDGKPLYREVSGGPPTSPPSAALDWSAVASGDGERSLRWDVTDGHWTVVLMNADGSGQVSAEVAAGATLPVLGWGAVTLLVAAGVVGVAGLVLVLLALPRPPSGTPADQITRVPTAGADSPVV